MIGGLPYTVLPNGNLSIPFCSHDYITIDEPKAKGEICRKCGFGSMSVNF